MPIAARANHEWDTLADRTRRLENARNPGAALPYFTEPRITRLATPHACCIATTPSDNSSRHATTRRRAGRHSKPPPGHHPVGVTAHEWRATVSTTQNTTMHAPNTWEAPHQGGTAHAR